MKPIALFRMFICLFLLLHWGCRLCAQNEHSITLGFQHQLFSQILQEEQKYWVYVPPSYSDTTLTEKYPVLYLLDGNLYFHIAGGIVHYSKGPFKLPETLVVGILNTDRIRDFTPSQSDLNMFGESIQGLENSGGADTFLSYIEKELIPHVEAQYRASSYRILMGHSFGGLLAGYAFSKGNSPFTSFLLIDPSFWWNNAEMVEYVQARKDSALLLGKSIYLGEADNRSESYFDNTPHIEAIQTWRNQLPDSLIRFQHDYFQGETHASVGLLALYKGLSFIFEGYRPHDSVFSQAHYLQQHYEALSKKWNGKFLPPEGLVRNLGFGAQYGQKDYEKAVTYFEMNVENYPNSPHAYRLLGEAYLAWGKREKGIFYLRQALSLEPENKLIQEKLNAVGEVQKN